MDALYKAYERLWILVSRHGIHMKTLDFDYVCRRIGARRQEMDALLEEELGCDGEDLLRLLRLGHMGQRVISVPARQMSKM